MKKLTLLALLMSTIAIGQEDKHQHDQDNNHRNEHEHKNEYNGGANHYMHQSSIDELVERFESKDRDKYQQPEKVLEYLGAVDGKKIMDIGAGTGYFSVKLAANGANVIAADVSDDFQNYLKERIKEENISNIELRKLPYDSPELAKNEVDKVLIVNTYHHIEDRISYFKKVRKGINADGELVIIDFFKADLPVGPPVGHKVAIDDVVLELKEAGFTEFIVEVSLLDYQYIIRAK
jgi:cyclopropane fatty-acyl-phospholipid synthase-like methyltransferase